MKTGVVSTSLMVCVILFFSCEKENIFEKYKDAPKLPKTEVNIQSLITDLTTPSDVSIPEPMTMEDLEKKVKVASKQKSDSGEKPVYRRAADLSGDWKDWIKRYRAFIERYNVSLKKLNAGDMTVTKDLDAMSDEFNQYTDEMSIRAKKLSGKEQLSFLEEYSKATDLLNAK